MKDEFDEWWEKNQEMFQHLQLNDKERAYAAYLNGFGMGKKNKFQYHEGLEEYYKEED